MCLYELWDDRVICDRVNHLIFDEFSSSLEVDCLGCKFIVPCTLDQFDQYVKDLSSGKFISFSMSKTKGLFCCVRFLL